MVAVVCLARVNLFARELVCSTDWVRLNLGFQILHTPVMPRERNLDAYAVVTAGMDMVNEWGRGGGRWRLSR